MMKERPLQVIWRRKWIVLVTFLVFTAGTGIISKSLPKVYSTATTMLIAQPDAKQSFDSVQAAQSVARSYADIIASPNFAERVADELGAGFSRDELTGATSFEPVPETQLLKVSAEDESPARAKQIADTYASVFTGYATANLARTTGANVSLADGAPIPRSPARPKPTLYTLVGSILGLVLGLGLAFASSFLDRRVRSDEELNEILGHPILAHIALARNHRTRVLNEEAYRVLRTNLEFVRPDKPLRTVAVVSPSAEEGKTSTVLNLGRAISEVGDRILLVEGDMRRPALQKALIPELEEPLRPGLSNVLSGTAEVSEAIHPTGDPNISIVPAGPVPPTPSTLLDSERGHKFLKLLEAKSDIVIVDTPPLSVGADAALLAANADETLMVVDTKRSSVKAITNALQGLELVKATLAGAIVNRVRDSTNESYAYGYTNVPKSRRRSFGRRRGRPTGQVEDPASPEPLPRETLAAEREDDG